MAVFVLEAGVDPLAAVGLGGAIGLERQWRPRLTRPLTIRTSIHTGEVHSVPQPRLG
jgi:uncharacterized membrane protein YhiD involved in acid resistance